MQHAGCIHPHPHHCRAAARCDVCVAGSMLQGKSGWRSACHAATVAGAAPDRRTSRGVVGWGGRRIGRGGLSRGLGRGLGRGRGRGVRLAADALARVTIKETTYAPTLHNSSRPSWARRLRRTRVARISCGERECFELNRRRQYQFSELHIQVSSYGGRMLEATASRTCRGHVETSIACTSRGSCTAP